jgi:DNA polymerase sigma
MGEKRTAYPSRHVKRDQPEDKRKEENVRKKKTRNSGRKRVSGSKFQVNVVALIPLSLIKL